MDEYLKLIVRLQALSQNGLAYVNNEFDKERYEEIIKEYKLGIGPKLLYKELDFSSKYIKDNVNEDIEKIVTNDIKLIYPLKKSKIYLAVNKVIKHQK